MASASDLGGYGPGRAGPGQLEAADSFVRPVKMKQCRDRREEQGGEVNLSQLHCFTALNPGRPVQGECTLWQIPNICMSRASEEKMAPNAITVSFTSRRASMPGAKLDASSQPLSATPF